MLSLSCGLLLRENIKVLNLLSWLINSDFDEKIVFCHGKKTDDQITFKEIKAEIFSLAYLLNQQVAKNIALYCDDIYHFYISFYACLISKKNIILPPNNTEGLKADLKGDYDAFLCFDKKAQQFLLNDQIICSEPRHLIDFEHLEISFERLSGSRIVFFSSGSTGAPKKITKQFQHLINEVLVLESFFSKAVQDNLVASSVHHQHLYGFIFYFLWPSLTLRKIHVSRISFSEELESLSSQCGSFTLISSPALLSRLTFKKNLSQITCFSAGSLLEKNITLTLMQHFNLAVIEILGSSETGVIAWRKQLNSSDWQCFESVEITQTDENILQVYANFFPEPYIETGDLVDLINPREFILLGRADRIVKIEGKRLALAELESKLKKHPWITDCYALNLRQTRDYIGVFIVLSDQGRLAKSQQQKIEFNRQLRYFLSHWYEKVFIPKSFRFGDKIPLNAQSKVDKGLIKKLF